MQCDNPLKNVRKLHVLVFQLCHASKGPKLNSRGEDSVYFHLTSMFKDLYHLCDNSRAVDMIVTRKTLVPFVYVNWDLLPNWAPHYQNSKIKTLNLFNAK